MSTKPGDWWTDSLNPIEGCTPISEACQNCWALQMLKRFKGWKPGQFDSFPWRLKQVDGWRKARRVFCGSMTDLFHEKILADPILFSELDHLVGLFDWHAQCTYILLTKRPANVHEYLFRSRRGAFGDNVWVGITAENQQRFNERIGDLKSVLCGKRFLHAEPLLGPIVLGDAAKWLDWVVVGGENGPGARPMHPRWVTDLRDECVAAGKPFWFKSFGSWQQIPFDPDEPRIPHNARWLNLAGGFGFHGEQVIAVKRVKNSGRILDGREWNDLPKGAHDEIHDS